MDEMERPEVWILAGLWMVGAVVVASVCRQKGQSGLFGFFVSLCLSPLFGILYAGALPDRWVLPEPTAESGTSDEGPARRQSRKTARLLEAKAKGRLCSKCGFVSDAPLDGRCPECGGVPE